jgi:transcriptional regulator with XRE-family HTH domain
MKLIDIRKGKSIRAVDLASKIGISQGYYSNLERGKRPFNEDLLRRTARILGVSVSTLRAAVKSTAAESYKLKSWMSNIRINGLPFIKAFHYHIQASMPDRHIQSDAELKRKIKEFIEENIGYSVLAELSENRTLLEEVREKIEHER